jgi:hypothetical protein
LTLHLSPFAPPRQELWVGEEKSSTGQETLVPGVPQAEGLARMTQRLTAPILRALEVGDLTAVGDEVGG